MLLRCFFSRLNFICLNEFCCRFFLFHIIRLRFSARIIFIARSLECCLDILCYFMLLSCALLRLSAISRLSQFRYEQRLRTSTTLPHFNKKTSSTTLIQTTNVNWPTHRFVASEMLLHFFSSLICHAHIWIACKHTQSVREEWKTPSDKTMKDFFHPIINYVTESEPNIITQLLFNSWCCALLLDCGLAHITRKSNHVFKVLIFFSI